MTLDDLDLSTLLDAPPGGGVLHFGGRRTLLMDAEVLGLLRTQLVETFGLTVARGVLTRLGFLHGLRIAEALETGLDWDSPRDWQRAGGRLHRLQGLVRFEPLPERADPRLPGPPDLAPFAHGLWHDSVEAEVHLAGLGRAEAPVCWMLCGFASGYLSRAFGEDVLVAEHRCRGCGDATCGMVARRRCDWGDALAALAPFFDEDCVEAAVGSLKQRIQRLEADVRARRRLLPEQDEAADGVIARSPGMRRILDQAIRVAAVDATVLITGESGVGKERVARLIHDRSPRAGGPFVAINCGALPPNLLESELFGHARGAFTGAVGARAGLFEAAHGGTVLLDEIGELPLALQARLLRVLQEREVRRVGETAPRAIDVRVLAATHRDLAEEVQAARFRADLRYRLAVVVLDVPPLRSRPEDIAPLARAHLATLSERYERRLTGLSAAALRRLTASPWPGNVRELFNAVERAAVFAEGPLVEAEDLPDLDGAAPRTGPSARPAMTLAEVERAHILATLEEVGGNRAEAARRLGIGQATLYRRLKRWRQDG